jgi:two-component system, NtrC family, nitrogen regulation response regulator GlnG
MKTILIVNDEQEALDAVGECLNRPGFRIVTMTDARLALAAVRGGEKVDMVITDHRMQGMDGLEFLTRLKEITPSVPVIILSSHVSIECYLKSLSLGAFEYVTKPFEARDLERIVKAAFQYEENGRISTQKMQA